MKDLSNENVIHVKKGDVEYLQFKKLLEYKDKIEHCFTLKNLSFGDNISYYELQDEVMNNYEKITNALELDKNNIVRPYQTHTNNVECITDEKGIFIKELKDVDGLLTNQKNEILSLTFADCMPIFLYDKNKNVIGNIHSGWKGTVKQIGKVAVQKMISFYGSNIEDIIVVIGPTIRKCHFEVEEDVKNLFVDSFRTEEIVELGEVKEGKQRYFIDAVKANIDMFKLLGIKEENIVDCGICTVCNKDIIHSYRAEGKLSGRNTSLIALK